MNPLEPNVTEKPFLKDPFLTKMTKISSFTPPWWWELVYVKLGKVKVLDSVQKITE